MAKLLLTMSLVIAVASVCSATVYNVGDSSGWDISTNMKTWSRDKKFAVGDALVFQYSSYNSVSEVTKEDFDKCNTSNVLRTFSNGNTTVPLSQPGDRYFVCGNKLYCLGGLKLHVHVEDNRVTAPAAAPQAESGSDQGASLPRQPSSKAKNIPTSAGFVNRPREIPLLTMMGFVATLSSLLQI